MDFAAYADAHHEARLVELSAPLAVKMPDCDARERVQRLRAWGRYLRGMDGAA
jgi:RDD domain-containing protein